MFDVLLLLLSLTDAYLMAIRAILLLNPCYSQFNYIIYYKLSADV